jgi:hypothetical protein
MRSRTYYVLDLQGVGSYDTYNEADLCSRDKSHLLLWDTGSPGELEEMRSIFVSEWEEYW